MSAQAVGPDSPDSYARPDAPGYPDSGYSPDGQARAGHYTQGHPLDGYPADDSPRNGNPPNGNPPAGYDHGWDSYPPPGYDQGWDFSPPGSGQGWEHYPPPGYDQSWDGYPPPGYDQPWDYPPRDYDQATDAHGPVPADYHMGVADHPPAARGNGFRADPEAGDWLPEDAAAEREHGAWQDDIPARRPAARTATAEGGRGPSTPEPSQDGDERWAAISYLAALFGFLPPLMIYLVNLRGSGFVRAHAAQATNAAITMTLYGFSGLIIGGLLVLDSIQAALILAGGALFALWLIWLSYLARAARAALAGRNARLPGWLCGTFLRR